MTDAAPSPWVVKHLPLLQPHSNVLDLACGKGRHTRLLLQQGHNVTAVDRQLAGVIDLKTKPGLELLELDLEGAHWPLTDRTFNGIVVTNYLYRPFLNELIRTLAADGVLIYATFAMGHEKYGRPRNPDFLLRPAELKELCADRLHIQAYEQTETPFPGGSVRQRICALGPEHPAVQHK